MIEPTRATVVGVTSKKGGVGKSVVATLIAWAAEQLGQRAVLMDLDPSNPDQLARDRVRYANVPHRMPTVLDDSYPTQWWSDPETGVQLLPGPTRGQDRTDDALIAAAQLLIPRAHGAADVVVLDLHQAATDTYTKELVELCDLVVCVTDHDAQSRQHLRSWLDDATSPQPADATLLPSLRPDQVRLVYSEGVPMTDATASDALSAARADMGPTYSWAGTIPFDPEIITGGNQGDITRAVSDTTREATLTIAAALLQTPPARASRTVATAHTASGHPWAPPRLPTPPAPDAGSDPATSRPAVEGPPPEPTGVVVRVFGTPRIDGRPNLSERELSIATLLAVRAPISVAAVGEVVGVTAKTISNTLGGLKGIVSSERGLLTLEYDVRSELTLIANLSEQLATATTEAAAHLISRAITLLQRIGGPPFETHVSGGWGWVHERLHAGPTPTERALLELGNLARAVANQWTASNKVDHPGLPSGSVVTGTLVAACERAAISIDPLPLLAAAAHIAVQSGPADRALVSGRLTAIAGDGWPVTDDLIASLA